MFGRVHACSNTRQQSTSNHTPHITSWILWISDIVCLGYCIRINKCIQVWLEYFSLDYTYHTTATAATATAATATTTVTILGTQGFIIVYIVTNMWG